MAEFEVFRTEEPDFKIIIAMKTCEAPLRYVSEIGKYLKSSNYIGSVLIDQLLHSGNTGERFISAMFNGERFENNSFEFTPIQRQHKVRQYMNSILRNNPESLHFTLLSDAQKQLILAGLDI